MKAKGFKRILGLLAMIVMIFTSMPHYAFASGNDEQTTTGNWKLKEVIWNEPVNLSSKVDFVFYSDNTVENLINTGNSLNSTSDPYAYKWLMDLYYFNETNKTSMYDNLKSEIASAMNHNDISTGNCKSKILGYLAIAKEEVTDYNLQVFDFDINYNAVKFIEDGESLTSYSSEAAYTWVTKVKTFFNANHLYVSDKIVSEANSAQNHNSILIGNCYNKIIGYMKSLVDMPSTTELIYKDGYAIVTDSELTILQDYDYYAIFEAEVTFNGQTYKDTKEVTNPDNPPVHKIIVVDTTWNGGSYDEMPSSVDFVLEESFGTAIQRIIRSTSNITCTGKTSSTATYSASVEYDGQTFTETKDYTKNITPRIEVVSVNWIGGSYSEAPTKVEFIIEEECGAIARFPKEADKVECIESTEDFKTYKATVSYNSLTFTDTKTYEKPVTLVAKPFIWNMSSNDNLHEMLTAAAKYVTYSGHNECWAESGIGIDQTYDGPGDYILTWTCTEGLTCDQTITLIESYINEPPLPVVPSAFDPNPYIDEFTDTLFVVKGQKFDIQDYVLVDSANKKYVSISKGVAKVKKYTDKVVKVTNGDNTIDLYIAKPMLPKTVTITKGEANTELIGLDTVYKQYWDSSNEDVVSVTPEGHLYGLKKGTSTVSLYVNGVKFSTKVTVKDSDKQMVTLIHMNAGSKTTIKGGKFSISGNNVVKVGKNKIKAISSGIAIITQGDTIYRLIVEDPAITEFNKTKKGNYSIESDIGCVIPIKYGYVEQSVVYKSSNPAVAYVREDGCIVTRKSGTTTLTTKINGKVVKIKVTVTDSVKTLFDC